MQIDRDRKQVRAHGRSTTLEILGGGSSARNGSARWSAQYRMLSEYRERMLHHRQSQSLEAKEEIATSGEHIADMGSDSYDRDWALAMASSTQTVLYEIDEALNRIRTGTYGRCELTGEAIEAERLRAIPWTRFSARAQAELEARGTTTRGAHLGELGSYAKVEAEGTRDLDDAEEAEGETRQAA